MVQIVKPGSPVKERKLGWPVGQKMQCDKCGCQFVIDEGDVKSQKVNCLIERRPNGLRRATMKCPQAGCGNATVVFEARGQAYGGVGKTNPADTATDTKAGMLIGPASRQQPSTASTVSQLDPEEGND